MKTILSLFIFLFVTSATSASIYPPYLYGDKNLIYCGAHQGIGFYIDKSSLIIEENTSSRCRIAVNELTAEFTSDGFHLDRLDSPIVNTKKSLFYYDLNNLKMYKWVEPSKYVKGNEWAYIYPVGSFAMTGHSFSGEIAFYIAFNKKFYGGRKHYNNQTHRYEKVNFTDVLYQYVDDAKK